MSKSKLVWEESWVETRRAVYGESFYLRAMNNGVWFVWHDGEVVSAGLAHPKTGEGAKKMAVAVAKAFAKARRLEKTK